MIRRIRELTRAAKASTRSSPPSSARSRRNSPEPGIGVLLAAKFIGEIAGIDRFTSTPNSPASPAAHRSPRLRTNRPPPPGPRR